MKRKHTRIIALIIVVAVVVTTVMSTVLAFADETDDDYSDYGYYDSDTVDYSQIAPAQSDFTIQQESLSGVMLTVPLVGVPDGVYLDWSDLSNESSSNPAISIDDSGLTSSEYTCLLTGYGSTVISFTIGTKQISVNVTIIPKYDLSKVKPARTNIVVCSQDSYAYVNIDLNGLPEMSNDDYQCLTVKNVVSSNPDMNINLDINYDGPQGLYMTVDGTGTSDVTFDFCGYPMKIKVTMIKAWIKEGAYRVAPGHSVTVKVKGDLEGIKPEFRSLSPKVASVSSSGKVRAKKNGTAVIVVSFGNGSDSEALGTCVNVASSKKIKAFNWARRYSEKNTYSQARRMSPGYYDCSSLVWRAYHSQGINLEMSNWAPTAADLGKYLVGKGKKVGNATDANYNKRKFQVGDLFFETGDNNGRYKGIYHVEMFGGYTFSGFDENGKPYITTTYASRGDGYGYGDDCFLCRP